MTAKRFTLMSVVNFDYGINDNDEPIGSLSNICDLLNNLAEENEQLKKDCTVLIYHNQEYRKVNEQLKKSVKRQQTSNEESSKYIEDICNENEQLKQQLQSILKLTRKIEDCTHDMKLIGDFE